MYYKCTNLTDGYYTYVSVGEGEDAAEKIRNTFIEFYKKTNRENAIKDMNIESEIVR